MNDPAEEARARRAAKRIGLQARKSRWRRNTLDNHGQFMLIEPSRNIPVLGWRYNASAADVIEYCEQGATSAGP